MSKINLFLVSLVAAIPGGVLSTILAMNFLTSADKMEGMMQLLTAATLGLSVLVTVLPLGILIWGAKTEKPAVAIKKDAKEAAASPSQAEISVAEEQVSDVVIPARDSGEFDVTDPEMAAFEDGSSVDDDAFATEAELASADFDEDFGDFEEEEIEEPKPKKKKKGKR